MGIGANLDGRRDQGQPFEGCREKYDRGTLAQGSAGSGLGQFQEEGEISAKALRHKGAWYM